MENMLLLIVQFSALIALGMFWYAVLKWSPEESLCMAVVSVISLVLVGAFFKQAEYAIVAVSVMSILGPVFLLKNNWKRSGVGIGSFFSPSVVLLAIVFLYGLVAFNGLHISNWDEMHQWGKSVNFMLHNNALPMGEFFDGEEVLLSSTTMFHYYFCKMAKIVTGEIVESNMYVSNLVLWFTATLLPLSDMKWKNWKSCFYYGIVVFLSMHLLFVQPYFNIYCDQPVVMWAGALIAWNLFCKKKKYHQVFVVLALMVTALMKNMMGPLFVAVVVLAMFIKYCMDFEMGFKQTFLKAIKKITLGKVIYSALCLIAIFILTVGWSWMIKSNALIRGDGIVKTGDDRLALTLKSGITKWFQPVNLSNATPNLTFFLFLFFTIIISVWFARKYLSGKIRNQYMVLMGLYEVGFLAFFALMIYTYLTTFSYADSIVTGSLNRYLSDYMLLGVIPVILPAFRNETEKSESGWKLNIGATILLIFFGMSTTHGFASKVIGINVKDSAVYQEILKMNDYKEAAESMMDRDEKIYMINQNADGILTVAADYVFEKNIDRAGMCYYFTKQKKDIVGLSHTIIRALPEILLNDYGYLWIYKTDQYFNENAFSVLKIAPVNGDFYKILNRDGRLRLEYLGNLHKVIEEKEKESERESEQTANE